MKKVWVVLHDQSFVVIVRIPPLLFFHFDIMHHIYQSLHIDTTGIRVQLNPCIELTRRKRGQNFVTFRLLFDIFYNMHLTITRWFT